MIENYNNFICEAKYSDLTPGTIVVFKKDSVVSNDKGRVKTKGKTATVIEKKKVRTGWGSEESRVTFEFENGKRFTINAYQLRGLDIFDKNIEDKLKSGEVIKFNATKDLLFIFKDIKFKKKGDYFDASYFDIVEDNFEMISFIPAKKTIKSEKHQGEFDMEKYRQQSRAGRVFKKLNPDLTDKEIESLSDEYKAAVESYIKGSNVQVVTGKDISYWYEERQYKSGNGSLNNSCMRYYDSTTKTRVSFYSYFPDKIAMAIILDDKKRLLARALIWKLDDGGVYMDRVYSVSGKYSAQIRKYGKRNKMLMFAKTKKILKVTLKTNKFKKWNYDFPYRDSFGVLNNNDGVIILQARF